MLKIKIDAVKKITIIPNQRNITQSNGQIVTYQPGRSSHSEVCKLRSTTTPKLNTTIVNFAEKKYEYEYIVKL